MNPHHFDPDPVGSALVIVYDACEGRLRADGTPAVMHPLAVMRLVHQADSRDPVTLAVALLHDVLEDMHRDQRTWEERIRTGLGDEVLRLVRLLTDDMALDAVARKSQQLARMPALPRALRTIKLADRLANLRAPRPDWSLARCRLYAAHTRALLALCREANPGLATALVHQLSRAPWGDPS